MTIGGWWVVVALERKGGRTVGEPLSEPALHAEAEGQMKALQKDRDEPLGLAYVRDEDHERRDESGAIIS